MKYLKKFNESNISDPHYIVILKEKFVDIFNDLVDLFFDEIDSVVDKYDRNKIYIIANLTLILDDNEFELFYTSTKENNKGLINVEDIIKIDYPKEPIVNNILNNKDILEKVSSRIDFALTEGYDDEMTLISCNYSYIIDKMKKLHSEFEFDMMDPYSFY